MNKAKLSIYYKTPLTVALFEEKEIKHLAMKQWNSLRLLCSPSEEKWPYDTTSTIIEEEEATHMRYFCKITVRVKKLQE